MTDRAHRGRTIVIAIIAWYFLMDIFTLVLGLRSGGLLTGIALAGMVVELALFYFLYTAHNWARLVMGLLSLGIALFGWWTGFNIRDLNLAGILVFLCLGGSFLLAAGLLFFSPDVREYFVERRGSRA
jgi:hypothetical protein